MKQATRRSQITVQFANRQRCIALDRRLLRRAIAKALRGAGVRKALISVAVVDDAAMTRLNWEYLRHRGPADVLSFLLDAADPHAGAKLEGEVVVDAEVALRAAPRYGWPPSNELLLYVVHGTLHLVGYDDRTPPQRAEMRKREKEVLQELGIARK
jgi:probable rRNA maturation factor